MLQRFSLAALLMLVPLGLAYSRRQTNRDPRLAPIPAQRAADSYSIYSMLMPGQPFSSMPPSQTPRWAIAENTINIDDMNPAIPPDGQLTPPPDNRRGFEEALDDYETRKHERFRLNSKYFQLGHPFTLLNDQQVSELRQARSSTTASSDLKSQYSGYPGVTFFSAVYFNHNQTAALVFMNNWCANLCAAGKWVYLEKQGGHWVRRSGISRGEA